MKKILVLFAILASIAFGSSASAYVIKKGDTLWNLYGSNWRSVATQNDITDPTKLRIGQVINEEETLGATNPVAGATYTLAGSGTTASAISITLTSLTIPQTGYELVDADFSSTFYVTLEPGNQKKQEIISCTTVTQNANNTATLSGCTRGLLPYSPFTADSDYAFAHAGGTSVIFSDAPQLFNEYTAKANNETITGTWTYNVRPNYIADTDTTNALDFVTLGQMSRQAISGASDMSPTVKGIGEQATATEIASSTLLGSTTAPLVVTTPYTTSSPYSGIGAGYIPVTQSNSKLSDSFTDFTTNKTYTGLNTFTATTTMATTTIASSTIDNLNVGTSSQSGTASFNGTVNLNSTVNGAFQNRMATSSANLKISADALNSTASASYVKMKEIQTAIGGYMRVDFLCYQNIGGTGNVTLYKNNLALGTEVICNGSTFTGSYWIGAGEAFQIYGKTNANTMTVYNFRIYYDIVTATVPYVVNND